MFIHTIFVPTIFFTALVWLTSTGPLFQVSVIAMHRCRAFIRSSSWHSLTLLLVGTQVDLPLEWVPKEIQPAIQFNGAFLAASLYGLYYTILEPVAGV